MYCRFLKAGGVGWVSECVCVCVPWKKIPPHPIGKRMSFYWAGIEPMTAQCREIQQRNTRGCGAEQRLQGVRLEMCVCTWEHLCICPDPSYCVCVCMCACRGRHQGCVCVSAQVWYFHLNQKRINQKSWLLSLFFFFSSKLSKCPARSAKFLSSAPLLHHHPPLGAVRIHTLQR